MDASPGISAGGGASGGAACRTGGELFGLSHDGPMALGVELGAGVVDIGDGEDATCGPIGDAVDAAADMSINSNCRGGGPGEADMP